MNPTRALRPGLAATLLALCACGDGGDVAQAPPSGGPSRVARGALRDEAGRALLLRGANVANAHKAPPYFGFHQADDFARLPRDWGMNAVRFLLSWAAIEPEEGAYDEAYLDAVALRLSWAHDAGLYVVLDLHQDLYGEGFGGDGAPRWTCAQAHYDAFVPTTPWFLGYLDPNMAACYDHFWGSEDLQASYAAALAHVAERLAGEPAVLGVDPMNEPYWGSYPMGAFEAERLQPFYERVVAAVRAAAPTWVAFLEPAASRNLGLPTGLTKMPVSDVVYSPHSYDRQAESGEPFDEARRGDVLANLAKLRGEADALGAALWVGELGGNADAPDIVPYMDAELDGADAARAGVSYWSYDRGGGYSMVGDDGSEKPLLMGTLVRPYPEFVAGDLLSFGWDDATRTFTVTWSVDPSVSAPTEIVVPERLYPAGYRVVSAGGSFEQLPGRLRVLVPPTGDPVTLSLETP